MRQLLSISILGIFIFLLGGRLVVNEILISQNRDAMMQAIRNGDFDKKTIEISLSSQEAKARIEGDEMSWLDQRYDIVSIEDKGDHLIIHALTDATEDRLMAGMADNYDNFTRQNPFGHKTPGNLLDDFFKEYTSCTGFNMVSNQNIDNWRIKSLSISPMVLDGYTNRPEQPPKYLAS